jgi:Zn finger protein HypA/HybF involved in hydrogenase expression
MASWGQITDRLAKADAARNAWLESRGARKLSCENCGATLQQHNLTGFCSKPQCRRERRRVRYLAWKALRLAGKKGHNP